jgi:ergothioneine biosynthesis protein EgtB
MKNIAASASTVSEKISMAHQTGLAGSLSPRLQSVRAHTVKLIDHLSPEDCQIQSMLDASPTKWHLAHTTWFFETFVLESLEPRFQAHDERFKVLFNSYYNGIGAKHPRAQRGLISRPSLDEVLIYRQAIDARVQALLSAQPQHTQLLAWLELGIQHEQQHQELILTDIKHVLSCNPAQPAFATRWPLTPVAPSPVQWLNFAGGLVETGQKAAGTDFCFDNETPRHARRVLGIHARWRLPAARTLAFNGLGLGSQLARWAAHNAFVLAM